MAIELDKYYNVRIKLRNDSHTNWEKKKDFIPFDGEVIIYDIPTKEENLKYNLNDISYQLLKIGDGITRLSELPFINEGILFQIKMGSDIGSISVNEKDIYVKGLNPEERDSYMAFKLSNNYYTTKETDNIIDKEKKARESAISEEKNLREEADKNLNSAIQQEEKNRKEEQVKLENSIKDTKEELEKSIEDSNSKNKVTLENPSSLLYNLKQGDILVGSINIPKDLFVKSGSVIVNPNGLAEGTYIKLILQNQSEPIYINVGSLVDLYTGVTGEQIKVEVNNTNRNISASIQNNSIKINMLNESIAQILELAENELSGDISINQRIANAIIQANQYTDEKIKEINGNINGLAEIAYTGNVQNLIQTDGDILILDCN